MAVREQSTQRAKAICDHVEALKAQIKAMRTDISTRRASNARRRADADAAKQNIEERRAATLSGIEKSIKRTDHLWRSVHARTTEDRSFLCHEAANLYGLKQRKRKKGGVVREEYAIGGIGISDLRDMNST